MEERRSTRTRKCITETYCDDKDSDESGDSEKEAPKKRKKQLDSDDTFEDSDFGGRVRRKARTGVKKAKEYSEFESEPSDDEDALKRPKRAVVKKPWSESDEEEEEERSNESDEGCRVRKSGRVKKSVLREPWSDEEDVTESEKQSTDVEEESERSVVGEESENEGLKRNDSKDEEKEDKNEVKTKKDQTNEELRYLEFF